MRFDLKADFCLLNEPQYIIDSKSIVSIDLFDTLIIRPPAIEKNLRQALSGWIALNCTTSMYTIKIKSIINDLCGIENNLRKAQKSNGFDPEIKRHVAYERLLIKLSQKIDIKIKTDQLIKWEIAYLSNVIKVNSVIAKLVETANAAGLRVIAVSDMYYSAQELTDLLSKIKAPHIDRIYVSCDVGFSKFRGGLFDYILKEEKVVSDRIIHIGDNRWSDVYSPRQKGIYSIHFNPKRYSDAYCSI